MQKKPLLKEKRGEKETQGRGGRVLRNSLIEIKLTTENTRDHREGSSWSSSLTYSCFLPSLHDDHPTTFPNASTLDSIETPLCSLVFSVVN